MQRLDLLLVDRGLAKSRSQAQRWIAEGKVAVRQAGEWLPVRKAGSKVEATVAIQVTASAEDRYVSRAGAKLAAALSRLTGAIDGAVVLDVGQSTGGFTDCVLQAGASRVVGVDVGHGQLAQSLREDPRVVCLEGVNARHLQPSDLSAYLPDSGFDLIVMDVSFISQRKILPQLPVLLAESGYLVSLVKPQFECGPQALNKHGVVTDASLYGKLQRGLCELLAQLGLQVVDYLESPIRGADGNREFLLIARKIT